MNLFDQITGKSSLQGFLGQEKSQIPSFQPIQQPIAPKIQNYAQPTMFSGATEQITQQFKQPMQEDVVTTQLKSKGYDDRDIEFLKQAKQKGYTSQQAFSYLESKKKIQQPVEQASFADSFKIKSSEKFGVTEGIKDIGKFLVNVPADSAEIIGGLYSAVTSPINTLTTGYKTLKGASDKAVYSVANSISSALGGKTVGPTEEAQMIDALGGYIKDTYGTAGKFKKAVVENPADTLFTLMGGLGVVSKVAEANNMTNVVNNINKIQQVINPVNILKQEAKLVTKPVGYIGKEVIPQVLGKTTGTSAETIKTAFRQGGTPEFQAALRGETTPQNILSNVQEGMQAIKNDRAIAYGVDYAKLQANKTQLSIDDVAQNFIKSLKDEYKIGVGKDGLDFSQSKITGGTSQSQIENMYKDIVGWKDKTPEGLDVLKQRLQDYYRGTPESSKGDRLSTIASNAIKKKIVDNVPEYANMTANYEKLTNDIRDITKTLSLGDKTQAQTAITKLSSVLRENFSARQDMIKLIEQYSGKNIQGQIAGASLNPLLAKGLAGVITGGGVVFGQLANPAFWGGLALASPRLIGEIANTIGVPIQKFKSAINNLKNANTTSNATRSAMEGSTKVKPFTKTPIVATKKVQKPSFEVTPKTIKPVEKTMKASEKINGLSEQDALYLYSDQKYKDINKALRSGNESSDMVKLIDSAISKNETDRAIRVYRGVDKNNLKDILKKQENGDVIYSDKAYLSTSMSPKVAKEFSDGFLLEINLPKGTKYAKNPVSEKEMEFILERGKSYKVTSQRKEGEFTILSLDPISSPKPISPQKTSVTQARGPIDPTTGKRKTIVQSPTAYEAGIRRPYTLNGNKPIVKRASDVEGVYNPKDKSIYIGENNFKAKPFQGFSYTSLESVIDSDIFKKIPELKSFKIEPSNKFGIDFKNEILYFPGTDKKLFKKANYQEYLSPDGLKEFGKFLNSISKDDFMDVVKKESNVFASKMKTTFENSKKIAEKEATIITKNPIKVYRGEGGSSIGNTTYVKGRYFADSKEFASTFGNVTESEIPAGTKIFDFSKINGNPEQKIIPPEILVDNDKLTAYIIDMGYDATMNKNSRGIEYVLLNKELNKVMKMKRNKEIIDPFKINFESVKDFWDNLDYLQKKSNYMIPDKIY